MAVDIESELAQVWAGSRVIASVLREKSLSRGDSLTVSTWVASGFETQIDRLAQILQISQSFALELAIKALYRTVNCDSNPENTHDLSRLFNSLSRDVKARLRSEWLKASGRGDILQDLSLDAFLDKYSLLFETSRYLYESKGSYSLNTKDFDIAIWLIVSEVINRQSDKTLLYNLFGVLMEEQEG